MKKRFFSLVLSLVMAGALMAGCSQGTTSPVATVSQLVDSVFYLKDSDAAYDSLGMNSQEMRTIFTDMAEQLLQSQFYPEPEEEVTDEEATAEEEAEDEEEVATEEEAVVEIRPEIKEMVQKQLSVMQDVVKYKTKVMTQSSTNAEIKLPLYSMDMSAYYTTYINIVSNMPEAPENPTEEEQAQLDEQWKQAYLESLDEVKTSSEPLDLTVQLYKSDGKWLVSNVENIISDLFYVYTGNY